MHLIGQLIWLLLWIFVGLLWVRFIVDWVMLFARNWRPKGVALVALEGAYSVTDPPIKALRKVIPPLRLGPVALDLSFLIVLLGAYVALGVVGGLVR